ncbi:MAG: hypothetical protein K9L60_10360 [Methylovulum sp.]|nr:hypothetical protein [Methylovulum sp.]MCF7999521.1 hypothetical protein [Methylovulum sp.]
MNLIKAIAAQLLGVALVMGLARFLPPDWHELRTLVMIQGIAAASCSRLLKQPSWWLVIHVLFLPLALGLLTLALPPLLFLVLAVLMLLVFWGTLKGDVPLFLSSQAVPEALNDLIKQEHICHFAELGSGTGTVAIPLARYQVQLNIEAFEHAPLPWLISVYRSRKLSNINNRRESFWLADFAQYQAVFAFLSPAVMTSLGEKIKREMPKGGLFISSSFPVQGWQPERILQLNDRRKTVLYCYRIR